MVRLDSNDAATQSFIESTLQLLYSRQRGEQQILLAARSGMGTLKRTRDRQIGAVGPARDGAIG